MRILRISICLLFVILLTSCTKRVWIHRDFEATKDNIETIAIMPPQIAYFERLAGSTEPKPERIPEVADNVQTALNEVLTEGGFTVKSSGLTDSLLATNQDLSLCFIRSQKRFSEICDSLGHLKIKKETYKVDPEIAVFSDIAGVDYLLFNRGLAYGTSGGGKVKDAVLSSLFGSGRPLQFEGLSLELLLIDANRAEAIWYNTNGTDSRYDPFRLNNVKNLCKNLLGNKLIEKK